AGRAGRRAGAGGRARRAGPAAPGSPHGVGARAAQEVRRERSALRAERDPSCLRPSSHQNAPLTPAPAPEGSTHAAGVHARACAGFPLLLVAGPPIAAPRAIAPAPEKARPSAKPRSLRPLRLSTSDWEKVVGGQVGRPPMVGQLPSERSASCSSTRKPIPT